MNGGSPRGPHEVPTSVPVKQIVLTLSDAPTCRDLSLPLPAMRTCFPVITASLRSQWGMAPRRENLCRVKHDSPVLTCMVLWERVRQLEWQVRATGHPQTGLNPMTGFSGARPDKHFHLRRITDTKGKFGCNCSYWVFLCAVKAGSCRLHGDSVTVPELQRKGNALIKNEECFA